MAIRPQELRIGNWVSLGSQKEILPEFVKTIGETGINGEEIYEHPDEGTMPSWREGKYEWLSPIPLTPDILQKAGFVKRVYETEKERELYDNLDLYYLPDGDMDESFILTPKDDGWFLSDHSIAKCQLFKYLHQIQNLYHVITGTELEIKEL